MAINRFTKNLMSRFPSWMKMSKDEDSIGAQFLDVFGITFQDFQDEIDETVRNFYINTANTEIIDWIYKVPLITERVTDGSGSLDIQEIYITDNEGNYKTVYRAHTVQKFYHREASLPIYWLDRANETIYLRVDLEELSDLDYPFKELVINGTPHYNLSLHHVWNLFDEFAFLLGLKRLYKESNLFLKERILDVFRKPGNTSRQGIQSGLERAFDLEEGSIQIKNLDNIEEDDTLMYPNGIPTRKLMKYAKQINETLKYSWDELNLDQAYWFSIQQDNIAIEYLPHIWDVDMSDFKKEDFQSGIGYGDDLYVNKPKEEARHRPVKVSIGLMGYVDEYEEVHPELTFKYKIYAKGQILQKDYQAQPFRYTIQSTEIFDQPYQIHAEANIFDKHTVSIENKSVIAKGTTAPNIHFGKSTDILHDQTHELVKLSLKYKQFEETESPVLENLHLIWEDTNGQEHSFPFNTESHFLIDRFNKSGKQTANVLSSSLIYEEGEGLSLSKGLFQDEIDTTEEFKTGTWDTNNMLIQEGNLQLNLEGMFSRSEFGPR